MGCVPRRPPPGPPLRYPYYRRDSQTHLKAGHPQVKYTGARSANESQCPVPTKVGFPAMAVGGRSTLDNWWYFHLSRGPIIQIKWWVSYQKPGREQNKVILSLTTGTVTHIVGTVNEPRYTSTCRGRIPWNSQSHEAAQVLMAPWW